jgi:hypothetical protein
MLIVESICELGFAYTRKVEEERAKELVKTSAKELQERCYRRLWSNQKKRATGGCPTLLFIGA